MNEDYYKDMSKKYNDQVGDLLGKTFGKDSKEYFDHLMKVPEKRLKSVKDQYLDMAIEMLVTGHEMLKHEENDSMILGNKHGINYYIHIWEKK